MKNSNTIDRLVYNQKILKGLVEIHAVELKQILTFKNNQTSLDAINFMLKIYGIKPPSNDEEAEQLLETTEIICSDLAGYPGESEGESGSLPANREF
ncbi:MAG: hypothetical protein LBP55_07455 [Candidatus Adiutrix sp.]|jgi:hypothetical protein|nr:hypothetical protein [Candidatus Adiutrix sp.]